MCAIGTNGASETERHALVDFPLTLRALTKTAFLKSMFCFNGARPINNQSGPRFQCITTDLRLSFSTRRTRRFTALSLAVGVTRRQRGAPYGLGYKVAAGTDPVRTQCRRCSRAETLAAE